MLGIEGFGPVFYTSPDELITHTGENLRLLVGQPVLKSWVLWNRHFDNWWSEWPVILKIGDIHLEICVWNDNQLSLSWDNIDLSKPLFPNSDGSGDHLFWKEDALPELVKIKGQVVKEIKIVEYRHQMTVLRDQPNPSLVGKLIDLGWLLNGIEFQLEQSYLSVWNALGGIGISESPETGSDIRKTVV